MLKKSKICVIGLGYVGLPLAISLAKYYSVIGFDKSYTRISELKKGNDITKEISRKKIRDSQILLTNNLSRIRNCRIFIITVPTPVDKKNVPDLRNLKNATKAVGNIIDKKSLVIFESTVFPGCTNEILVPILKKQSGLKLNKDFYVAYSPERINPGKSKFKLSNQIKIVSGSNIIAERRVFQIYKKIIKKGIHIAKSIKIAEAAKIIENTQRDINIAFVNELSMLFHRMNINTSEVLAASKTKWNFINFNPGLVGGHCIGVDPYYLKHKALKLGFKPKIISSGRDVNDRIPEFIFGEIKKIIGERKKRKVLFLGITFKENCNDFRNSKAILLHNMIKKKHNVDVFDPVVNKNLLEKKHNIKIIEKIIKNFYDVIVIAVPHDQIKKFSINYLRSYSKKNSIIIDIKSIYPRNKVEWQL